MSNDVTIIMFMFVFFVGLGTLLPFVQEAFGQTQINVGTDELIDDISDNTSNSSLTIWKVLLSVIKMFFWTFGDLPIIIDAIIMLPLRLGFAFLVARNVWVGGGG